MAKITGLSALGAAPESTDVFPFVDVSDTAQSANGSTKKVTMANVTAGVEALLDQLSSANLQMSTQLHLIQAGGGSFLTNNAYFDAGWKYRVTGAAALIGAGTSVDFRQVASGSANAAITWTTTARFNATTGNFEPGTDDTFDLGSAGARWDDIFATNATIQTSDASLKTDIEDSDIGWDFIRALRPVKYRWAERTTTDPETGEETVKPAGRRPHYGLIAQEVKAVMDAQGIADFAGYIYDEDSGRHGLRYGELWAPLIAAIQRGADIIEAQQAQIEALTARVEALEAV